MPVLLFHHFCHEKDWDQGLVNSAAFEKNIIEHKNARQATPTLHLWHPENDRSSLERNKERLRAIMSSDRIAANIGLEQIGL